MMKQRRAGKDVGDGLLRRWKIRFSINLGGLGHKHESPTQPVYVSRTHRPRSCFIREARESRCLCDQLPSRRPGQRSTQAEGAEAMQQNAACEQLQVSQRKALILKCGKVHL